MNIFRNSILPWLACLVVSPFLLGSNCAIAQPDTVSEEVQQILETRIDVEFDGGKLEDFARQIKANDSTKTLNIVISAHVRDVIVPPLRLSRAKIRNIFSVLQQICVADSGESLLSVNLPEHSGNECVLLQSTYIEPPKAVSVYSIANIKELKISQETLLKTVDSVMHMNNSANVKVQVHEEAGLLIAMGTATELALIENTIAEMSRPVQELRGWSAPGQGSSGRGGMGGMGGGGMGMGGGGQSGGMF